MHTQTITLKPGRESAVLNRHHWVFSGAIADFPAVDNGSIVKVKSHTGQFLGQAYVNAHTSIRARMLTFDDQPIEVAVKNLLAAAIEMRKKYFAAENTTAYRLIHSEGDFLPGLIVDKYGEVLVVQIATWGMENLKPVVVSALQELCRPLAIFERSDIPSRDIEQIPRIKGWLVGDEKCLDSSAMVKITENGVEYLVDVVNGQKTGFFLDQREMRSYIRDLANKKRVLNCFSYTGGFSIAALQGGAVAATSIDSSEAALALAQKNADLNQASSKHHTIKADILKWLPTADLAPYEVLIVDPPAFAKKKDDLHSAIKAYRELNTQVLAKTKVGATVVTSSCSGLVDEKLFQKIIFQSAVAAGRQVRVIGRHRLAPDHPINICHPETEYLKSLILYVW